MRALIALALTIWLLDMAGWLAIAGQVTLLIGTFGTLWLLWKMVGERMDEAPPPPRPAPRRHYEEW